MVDRNSRRRQGGIGPAGADGTQESDRRRIRKIIAAEYDGLARVWDRYFVPATAPMRAKLIELAHIAPGEKVLDIGTGTGAAALAAAHRVGDAGSVLGIDVSQGMLEQARAKAVRLRLQNVQFRKMDLTSLRLPGEFFDALISCFGIPDRAVDHTAALKEWWRVLRPGGRLTFCEGTSDSPAEETFAKVFGKYKAKAPSPALAERRRLGELISEEAQRLPSIDPAKPEGATRLMGEAGFENVRVLSETFANLVPNARAAMDWLLTVDYSAEYAEMPPRVRSRFRREVLEALRPFESSVDFMRAETTFFFGERAMKLYHQYRVPRPRSSTRRSPKRR